MLSKDQITNPNLFYFCGSVVNIKMILIRVR